jgi:hypothetical protein
MDSRARERAIRAILRGQSVAVALKKAAAGPNPIFRLLPRQSPMFRFIVQPGGSLSKIPDPACVARHLEGKTPITRQDIERALDACSD